MSSRPAVSFIRLFLRICRDTHAHTSHPYLICAHPLATLSYTHIHSGVPEEHFVQPRVQEILLSVLFVWAALHKATAYRQVRFLCVWLDRWTVPRLVN